MIFTYKLNLISGYTSGALQFSPLKRHISTFKAHKFTQCLDGFGRLVVRTRERFSFGCFFGTG
jgi:hypothetical protein